MPTSHQIAPPLVAGASLMKAWLERALRTAEAVAGEGDAGAQLRTRSGALWLLAVLASVGLAWATTSLAVAGAWSVGLALIVAGVVVGLSLRATVAAALSLFAVASGVGLLMGGVDAALLAGVGTSFSAAFLLAEALALVTLAAARPALAAPTGVAAAAAATGALAWVLEGSAIPATPWGIATGGALAVLLSLHARWGEGAIALRHGPHQLWHAAASRWLEATRGLLVRAVGFFSADDDLFSSPTT